MWFFKKSFVSPYSLSWITSEGFFSQIINKNIIKYLLQEITRKKFCDFYQVQLADELFNEIK